MFAIRDVQKLHNDRVVLQIDALDVAKGEVVGIVGQFNEGRQYLMQALCGEIDLSRGSICFDGKSLTDPAIRQRVGVLFADDLLYDRLSVEEFLAFAAELCGAPAERLQMVLNQLGLRDHARTRISKLQPAQQRRLAFARALMAQRGLLILERPIARADLATQDLMIQAIQGAAAEGAAVLLLDDDQTWAGRCCDRIYELIDGRISAAIDANILPLTSGERLSTGGAEEGENMVAPERLVPFKVPARRDDRIVLFDPGEILFATSRDGKTYLRTVAEEATTNLTLQELEGRLSGRGFFKAHRAYLVNLQHIRAVIQFTRNSYSLQLDDAQQTTIPLSKQSEKELQTLLGY